MAPLLPGKRRLTCDNWHFLRFKLAYVHSQIAACRSQRKTCSPSTRLHGRSMTCTAPSSRRQMGFIHKHAQEQQRTLDLSRLNGETGKAKPEVGQKRTRVTTTHRITAVDIVRCSACIPSTARHKAPENRCLGSCQGLDLQALGRYRLVFIGA